jgi:protein kinase A
MQYPPQPIHRRISMKIREAGHNMAAAVFHHGSQSTPALTPEQMAQAAEQEKEFIARFSDVQRPLAPGEVQQAPRNKELGKSSKGLSVRDFELVRTLGTGTYLGNSAATGRFGRGHAY